MIHIRFHAKGFILSIYEIAISSILAMRNFHPFSWILIEVFVVLDRYSPLLWNSLYTSQNIWWQIAYLWKENEIVILLMHSVSKCLNFCKQMSTPFEKVNWAKTNFSRANKSVRKSFRNTCVKHTFLHSSYISSAIFYVQIKKQKINEGKQGRNES